MTPYYGSVLNSHSYPFISSEIVVQFTKKVEKNWKVANKWTSIEHGLELLYNHISSDIVAQFTEKVDQNWKIVTN